MSPGSERGLKTADAAAFFAIYVFWGGTFLARSAAIASIPPFLMAGCQFTLAGILMGLYASARGAARPSRRDAVQALLPGFLILSCGTGLLAWAQQTVAGGVAALLTASVPLWIAVLENFRRRTLPAFREVFGIAAGLAGIIVLVRPESGGAGSPNLAGCLVLILAAFLWAFGSLLCRDRGAHLDSARWLSLQLLWGGGILLMFSFLDGTAQGFEPGQVTAASWTGFIYLVLFGGFGGFLAYDWLLRRVEASAVATHAFVNPLIAVLLGWAFADEKVGLRAAVAGALILLSVALLIRRESTSRLDAAGGKGRIRA